MPRSHRLTLIGRLQRVKELAADIPRLSGQQTAVTYAVANQIRQDIEAVLQGLSCRERHDKTATLAISEELN